MMIVITMIIPIRMLIVIMNIHKQILLNNCNNSDNNDATNKNIDLYPKHSNECEY